LTPIKINAVIVRGHNENEVVDFAKFARDYDLKMRFIEFMPLDSGHEWAREQVVSGKEIRQRINEQFPLAAINEPRGSETSTRYRFADDAPGEIGIIAPVTEPFCGACSRIRLTADGQIRTCLFSVVEHSLRDVIRSGATRAETIEFIESVVLKKEPRHYINDPQFVTPSRSMSFIGG
jgi:cyclic pyranopterin phosphate synthase